MTRMPSVMKHAFSQVPSADIPRSRFSRNSGHKTTFNAGNLIPIFLDEVLPGDTFNLSTSGFGRLATPIHPVMDNLHLETFYFFVPNRLVWDNWQKFNGEQKKPGDSTDYLIPVIETPAGGFPNSSLADYFGLPTEVEIQGGVNALPFRAYALIFNEWFRDENLVNPIEFSTGDGPDDPSSLNATVRRGKRHDYFTSCLPWPQKGDSVDLPLGLSAPIYGSGDALVFTDGTNNFGLGTTTNDGDFHPYSGNVGLPVGSPNNTSGPGSPNSTVYGLATSGDTGIYTDLTDATAATINQLRQAFQIQRLYERDARGGTRYIEIIRSHFGVISPDARLQRPEYLGGGSTDVTISPIAQTSASGDYAQSPQGNLAAMGTVAFNNHGFSKSFTEHGYIIGLACVRADLTYQQTLHKMWTRQTRWDFYWPALSHLGEQAVLNKEIYCSGDPVKDDEVFGYQERFAEYRYKNSLICGKFRSNYAQSLDVWHLSQDFTTTPTLSPSFIQEFPPVDRVIAVTDEPHFIMDFYHRLTCDRPMPVYSVPGMIDHF